MDSVLSTVVPAVTNPQFIQPFFSTGPLDLQYLLWKINLSYMLKINL